MSTFFFSCLSLFPPVSFHSLLLCCCFLPQYAIYSVSHKVHVLSVVYVVVSYLIWFSLSLDCYCLKMQYAESRLYAFVLSFKRIWAGHSSMDDTILHKFNDSVIHIIHNITKTSIINILICYNRKSTVIILILTVCSNRPFTADIVTCSSRKSTCVFENTDDGSIPFSGSPGILPACSLEQLTWILDEMKPFLMQVFPSVLVCVMTNQNMCCEKGLFPPKTISLTRQQKVAKSTYQQTLSKNILP